MRCVWGERGAVPRRGPAARSPGTKALLPDVSSAPRSPKPSARPATQFEAGPGPGAPADQLHWMGSPTRFARVPLCLGPAVFAASSSSAADSDHAGVQMSPRPLLCNPPCLSSAHHPVVSLLPGMGASGSAGSPKLPAPTPATVTKASASSKTVPSFQKCLVLKGLTRFAAVVNCGNCLLCKTLLFYFVCTKNSLETAVSE